MARVCVSMFPNWSRVKGEVQERAKSEAMALESDGLASASGQSGSIECGCEVVFNTAIEDRVGEGSIEQVN